MPKSIHLFFFLLVICAFLLCFYFSEIERNVSLRFGPHLSGSNLRNLRSSDDVPILPPSSSLTGSLAVPGRLTPSSSVSSTPVSSRDRDNNITSFMNHLGYEDPSVGGTGMVHLAVIFCNAGQKAALKRNFLKMTHSLLSLCSPKLSLHFHLVTDPDSWETAKQIVHSQASQFKLNVQISAYFIEAFAEQFGSTIEVLQQYFSAKPGTYYSQALFYVSVRLPQIIPSDVDRLVFVDVDTEFRDGLEKLIMHFDYFDGDQLLGLAPELSPVYRHILYIYRNRHKTTLLGEPKGRGFPGYNSGVVLMKLEEMRQSSLYNALLTNSSLAELTTKYSFKGHLGDQDFYTLAALEHPHLFYTLPCNWNRQLCQWWKSKGYDDIFDLFYECKGFISLYHGNCNSQIP